MNPNVIPFAHVKFTKQRSLLKLKNEVDEAQFMPFHQVDLKKMQRAYTQRN
jgi:hypothetical protein